MNGRATRVEILQALAATGGKGDNRSLGWALEVQPWRMSILLCGMARAGLVKRTLRGHRGRASEWQVINKVTSHE